MINFDFGSISVTFSIFSVIGHPIVNPAVKLSFHKMFTFLITTFFTVNLSILTTFRDHPVHLASSQRPIQRPSQNYF